MLLVLGGLADFAVDLDVANDQGRQGDDSRDQELLPTIRHLK